ncbi:MAG: 6,7-dimethyl-8-ribityllumazine synthase [Rhizobiaceae bacterium]|nr:6,7-dimethyl-8-ribityllumazine synthase [Rhizobiaceae bacterium]
MNQKKTSKQLNIAFIQASWHEKIVDQARVGFVDEISNSVNVDNYKVPGAFEIPLLAKRLAQSGKYDAVIAAGFVVDGGIYRHEFVASTVVNALMQVQLETDVPVFCVVLTPHNFQETEDHTVFFREHMIGKGREAARACVKLL